MATAQALSALAFAPGADPAIEQGDLSLALAGAELIDLLGLGAVRLAGARILPVAPARTEDSMLVEAASEVVQDDSHETVESWLWRRGNGLAARYRAALGAGGSAAPAHSSRNPFRRARPVSVDPRVLGEATERLETGDPVLAGLAASAGVRAAPPDEALTGLGADETVVLAEVHQAVTRLAGERQRRSIEQDAFDNVWRGY
ncbi:GPP34 family phosphoprotein [Streptomyces griseoaurantiacus]|uniref:GPP34 family phosphoprotein n=1 Tax=Streptomyces griseoaurantiacus TaxID=68213 RepID=UPI00346038DC